MSKAKASSSGGDRVVRERFPLSSLIAPSRSLCSLPPKTSPWTLSFSSRSQHTLFLGLTAIALSPRARRCEQSSELFTLTYGALVRHLLLDLESPEEVNKQLDKMGQNIGVRLVDDFLAKTSTTRCRNFREAAKTIAETGFKMFLGISAKVMQIDDKECKMVGPGLGADCGPKSLEHLLPPPFSPPWLTVVPPLSHRSRL